MSELLIAQEKYLESGIHIGTKLKTPDMKQYIYKARQDKLFVLDLKRVDERIRNAAVIISKYEPSGVFVVASRTYAALAASKFAMITGANVKQGRFIPGNMTNPARPDFFEPKLIIVCDPKNERQAIREAAGNGVPVISLCDTDNSTRFIDWVIPCNNKGKKSLALIFFLLAREVSKARGLVASDAEFGHTLEEFDVPLEAQEDAPEAAPAAPLPAPVAAEGERPFSTPTDASKPKRLVRTAKKPEPKKAEGEAGEAGAEGDASEGEKAAEAEPAEKAEG
jgi:small subunit ribosomal protein S2